jgi:hypothetical protein
VGGVRRDGAQIVRLQVLDLLALAIHAEAWMLRYVCGLPLEVCGVCQGQGFLNEAGEGVPDPFLDPHADLASEVFRSACPECRGSRGQVSGELAQRVASFVGWERARRFRGRLFKRHGLDYELRWIVGGATWIEGDTPPRTALGAWYRWAQEECSKHGYLLAVDLMCSQDVSCRRIGERLLGRRCDACEGRGESYTSLRGGFRFEECSACAGSGSVVEWWR